MSAASLVILCVVWWLLAVGEVAEKTHEPGVMNTSSSARYGSAPGKDGKEFVKVPK